MDRELQQMLDGARRSSSDNGNHMIDQVLAGAMSRRDFIRRATIAGMSVPVIGVVLAACGSSSTGSSTSGSPSSSARKTPSIVYVSEATSNPWVLANQGFATDVARALGIHLQIIANNNTDNSDVAAIRQAIALQPDGIVNDPYSATSGVEDARLMEEYTIPFANYDRVFVKAVSDYQGKYLIAQAGAYQPVTGKLTAQGLIATGATKIVTIMSPHGDTNTELGWAAMVPVFAAAPQVKILEQQWTLATRENDYAVMQRYLVKYPSGTIDGLLGIGSLTCLAAVDAIKAANRLHEFKGIVTWDLGPDVISAIESGDLSGSMGGNHLEGGFALIMLYDHLNGHAPVDPQPAMTEVYINKSSADTFNTRWNLEPVLTADEIRSISLTYNPKANLPQFMANFGLNWNTPSRGMPPYANPAPSTES